MHPMRPRDQADPRPPLRAVLVVVPARDEEDEIGGALTAVAAAAHEGGLPTTVVTVLDRCTDRTGEVAAAVAATHPHLRWLTVEADAGSLGRVRGQGVEAGRAAYPDLDPAQLWVASTDADSRVPPAWLREQRALADRGLDLVLGTVEPVDDGTHPEAMRLWWAQHHLLEGHTAVYGANLGVRLSAYDTAGGFPALDDGEDAHLVHRVREVAALPWTSTDRTRVRTSARRRGRAGAGFAGFLRRLDETVESHGVTEEIVALLRSRTLQLLRDDPSTTPAEVAAAVDPDHPTALAHLARAVACLLADEGLVVITQDGLVVDGRRTSGTVRIEPAPFPAVPVSHP